MVHKKKSTDLGKLYRQSKVKAEKDIAKFRKATKPLVEVTKKGIAGAKKGYEYAMKGFEMTTGLQAKMMDKMWEEQAKMRKEMEEGSKMD